MEQAGQSPNSPRSVRLPMTVLGSLFAQSLVGDGNVVLKAW